MYLGHIRVNFTIKTLYWIIDYSNKYPRSPYLSLALGHGLPPYPYPQHPLAHPQYQQQPLSVQPPLSPLVTKATGKSFNDGKYVHDPSGNIHTQIYISPKHKFTFLGVGF